MHGPVLFPGTFQRTPRKTKMSSSLPEKTFQTCGSAHAFFQVLGDSFPSWGRPELLRELPASHPSSVPLWLPDQDGTCSIFPTRSRNTFVYPAVLPFPPQPLHSTRLDPWTCLENTTFQRDAPGQPRSVWVHIPRPLANPSPLVQPTPTSGCLSHMDFPSPVALTGPRSRGVP